MYMMNFDLIETLAYLRHSSSLLLPPGPTTYLLPTTALCHPYFIIIIIIITPIAFPQNLLSVDCVPMSVALSGFSNTFLFIVCTVGTAHACHSICGIWRLPWVKVSLSPAPPLQTLRIKQHSDANAHQQFCTLVIVMMI